MIRLAKKSKQCTSRLLSKPSTWSVWISYLLRVIAVFMKPLNWSLSISVSYSMILRKASEQKKLRRKARLAKRPTSSNSLIQLYPTSKTAVRVWLTLSQCGKIQRTRCALICLKMSAKFKSKQFINRKDLNIGLCLYHS